MATPRRCSPRSLCPGGYRPWLIGLVIALALLASTLPAPRVHAESGTVGCGANRTDELIAAVAAANTGGPSTVSLTPGCVYDVHHGRPQAGQLGTNALPIITGNVTIAGNGAVIRGAAQSNLLPTRLFQVNSGASLAIQDLTIRGYIQTGFGGALLVNGGTLALTYTTVTDNLATLRAGGLYVDTGTVTLTNSTISNNHSSGSAGGLYVNNGTVTLNNSTISGNRAAGTDDGSGGGMLLSAGTVTVTNSTISGNEANGLSGSGGGVAVGSATMTLTNSTVEGNFAQGNGGGLAEFSSGTVRLVNSTVSGNTAGATWDGNDHLGGGLYLIGIATLINSTVTSNAAVGQRLSFSGAGGLYAADGQVTLTNTLVAANSAGTLIFGMPTPNCGIGTSITNGGNNLQDQGTSCGGGIATTADAGLTSVPGHNGGPTRTVALQAGSPAINAGNAAVCAADPVNNRDQRGFARVGTCDIGAFEFGAVAVPRSLTVTTSGTGSGTVTSAPGGIACGSTCQAAFLDGTAVTLTAAPSGGSAFAGWTGACTGSGACTPAIDSDRTVGAIFTPGETTPPDTTIDLKPPSVTNSTSASIGFSGTDNVGVTGFECQLDGGGFTACTSPAIYSGLGQGSHTFQVRAIDAAGNVDPSPAGVTWTVDTTAPDTTIDMRPPSMASSSSASFSFSASEAGGTFACKLDTGAFVACSSPQSYSGLADGSHTFQVQATDAAGNTDPSPAGYTWLIESDSVPPETRLTAQPANPTNATAASFGFAGSDNTTPATGLTFACRVDGGAFAACTSPKSYSGLAEGSHTFEVRATDAAGNTDASPASYTWTVDTTAPAVTVPASMTAEATSGAGAVVTFTASATDTNPASPAVGCTPASGGTFAITTTTVTCSATDAAGSTGSASFSITVRDTTAPALTVPASITVDATSSAGAAVPFAVSATDAVTATPAITCTINSGATVVTSGASFPIATTTVSCTAKDGANNTSAAKTFTVTVKSAAAQATDLLGEVRALPLDPPTMNNLTSILQSAQTAIGRGDVAGACDKLGSFINQVNAQSGKKIAKATADELIADAQRIKRVLGCA